MVDVVWQITSVKPGLRMVVVVHAHPGPLPDGLMSVWGIGSSTCVVPEQADPPFVTVIVNVTFCPIWTVFGQLGVAVLLAVKVHGTLVDTIPRGVIVIVVHDWLVGGVLAAFATSAQLV
jgi:hypothetical protein